MRIAPAKGGLALAFVAVFLPACESVDSQLTNWVGRPIAEYASAKGGPPPTQLRGPDEQGNRVYVERVENGGDCAVMWNVDMQGIIRGWSHEGPSCRYYMRSEGT